MEGEEETAELPFLYCCGQLVALQILCDGDFRAVGK